jgi:hypothetical protein
MSSKTDNQEALARLGITHSKNQSTIKVYKEKLQQMRQDLAKQEDRRIADQNRLKVPPVQIITDK